jgi:hypoxanthine phosphoribosyltransferase
VVLIVDDFCTEGNSFETARAYIENTGATAICLAWLKTINTDYREIRPIPKLKPYEPNHLDKAPNRVAHWFSHHIRNAGATADLQQVFDRYYHWKWPGDRSRTATKRSALARREATAANLC